VCYSYRFLGSSSLCPRIPTSGEEVPYIRLGIRGSCRMTGRTLSPDRGLVLLYGLVYSSYCCLVLFCPHAQLRLPAL